MKMLLSLLLLFAVPVVVAQTFVDAPLLEEPADAIQDHATVVDRVAEDHREDRVVRVEQRVDRQRKTGEHPAVVLHGFDVELVQVVRDPAALG